jgi:uncharacterized protein (TIGR02597 family)
MNLTPKLRKKTQDFSLGPQALGLTPLEVALLHATVISRHFPILIASALAIALPSVLSAQTVSTPPVGVMSYAIPANTDVLMSSPLHRDAVFTGPIVSVSGSQINVGGSPAWTPNQFAYVQGTQPNTYYVQVLTGTMRGAYFTVTANTASQLTVDLNGETLAALTSSDRVSVIPYWTLSTLFPVGGGFPGSPSFTPVTEVQFVSLNGVGTNLATTDIFFYYTGTAAGGAGWRRSGSPPTTKFDNTIFLPDAPYRIRNRSSVINLSHLGNAPVAGHRTTVGTLAPSRIQDNFVTLMSAADTTLANSGLISSGAFAGSPSFTPVDTLLVFNNQAPGLNKAPSSLYFYYTGTAAGGPGWRKSGSPPTTLFNNEVLKSQDGFIIRKASSSSPQLSSWSYVPTYATN